MKDAQTLPEADIDFDHNLLVAKICTRPKNIVKIQKGNPRWDLETLHVQRQRMQNNLEEKLVAIQSGSGNVEMQWEI
jgi:hypothetical protein